MKKLLSILILCLGCFGFLEAQDIWKPINGTGILGAGPDGSIFAYGEYGALLRSQDEGETWQIVLGQETGFSGSVNHSCFAVSPEERVFVFNDNSQTVVYSDDNGDTWHQTTSFSPYCAFPTKTGLYAVTNDIFVVWAQEGEFQYTLDGGETWNGCVIEFVAELTENKSVTDLIVSENGDIYVSVSYSFRSNSIGIYHSTFPDINNWELVAFEGISIKDMAFDPEGNVVACGYDADGSSVGFQHVPGFYLFDGTTLAISDGGIVYRPHFVGNQAILSYSTDHGEHFTEIGEHVPLVDIAPGGDAFFLIKGYDNHLYFDGGGEYWKSVQSADEIIADTPTSYYPLVHEGNDRQKWNVVYIGANENYPNDYHTEIQSIRDNINLDGVDYKLVWRESVYESKKIAGAVREEDKRVYFRRYWGQSYEDEVLLYDFNLTVGDTVTVGWADYQLIVLEESEIEVNGTMRRQLGLAEYFAGSTNYEVEEYWIEGVGSTYGFLNSGYEGWVGAFVHLLCYHENGNLIWDNEEFDDCVMNSNGAPASFAPHGAEWYFNEFDPWSPHPYYSRFYVSGDTVVQGHPCSVINTQFIETGHDGIELVYEENNKVYWFNPTNNNFTILYDFDAEVGDSWYCEVDSCSHLVTVESVENVTWNGHTYRAQWVKSYEDDIVVFDGRIIEGIGYEKGLFPFNWACHGDIWFDYGELDYLRCYVVDGEILYHEGNYDCDYVYVNTFCWDGTVAEAYDGGDGTEENPYQIVNAQQLALLAKQTNDGTGGDAYYKLTANINLERCTGGYNTWTSIGVPENETTPRYFTGHFDGDGNNILNLYQLHDATFKGLFGCTNGAEIKDVNLAYCQIGNASEYAGGLVGYAGRTTVSGCSIENSTVQCNEGRAGGLVGYMGTPYLVTEVNDTDACLVTNCQTLNDVQVKGTRVGGIVAESNLNLPLTPCEVANCQNYGTIINTAGGTSGGVGGWMIHTNVTNCANHGSVSATSWSYAGGVIGLISRSSVSDCYNDGNVSSSNLSGGVIALIHPLPDLEIDDTVFFVRNCHNVGEVFVNQNATHGCAGGVIARIHGGYVHYRIMDCSNRGDVICERETASGVVGNMIGNEWHTIYLLNMYNAGNVSANESSAGIISRLSRNVVLQNVYNAGAIEGEAENKGAIIAEQENSDGVSHCYWLYNTEDVEEDASLPHSCAFYPTTYYGEWRLDSLQFGNDLVAALNVGAEQIESLYPEFGPLSRWGYDVEEVNNGFPVLVPNNSEDDALEAYCEAPFNFGGSPISNQGNYGTQLWWNKPFASHWFHYDEKPYEGAVYCNNWGIKIPAEEIHAGDVLTHVAFYMDGGQNQTVSYVFAFGFDGETEPDSWDYLPGNSVQIEPGTDGWVMVKLGSPIICEEGKCLWIILSAPNVEGNNASYCQASGNPNACWSSEGSVAGDWMIRGYFTNDVGYNEAGYNDELDHYNIYRGRTLEELEKIAEVDRDEEEYFDTLQNPFGDYYYQLTAAYTDGRESVPAKRGENPHDKDYVYFHVGNISSLESEWYYEIENGDGSITYQHLEYDADTTVNDKEVKIIIRTNTLYDKVEHNEVTREYIYEDFGKVYWWNTELQDFTLLYDLGAQIGDEWVIRVGTESLTMHVDSVEQYEYEGTTYRMLRVSDADDLFSGVIMSGIGHLSSFFPERLMTRGKGYRVEGIRCYWREGQLVFKYGDKDCDEVYEQIHFDVEESVETQFKVYPNPTDGVLFVETRRATSLQTETYRITNLMGQTVLTGSLNAENQQIDVSVLPQGMYFFTFVGETRKFVVK